jgi:hypothetical protein
MSTNGGTPLGTLLSRLDAAHIEPPAGETVPLSERDLTTLAKHLAHWTKTELGPVLLNSVQPEISELYKRLSRLPAASSGLTELEIKALAKALVNYLRTGFAPEMMERLVKPELAAIDTRLAALEAKRSVTYEGIFDPAKSYSPGMLCTHHGSVWHCERACTGVSPDTEAGSETWVLAVKKGRDARDKR